MKRRSPALLTAALGAFLLSAAPGCDRGVAPEQEPEYIAAPPAPHSVEYSAAEPIKLEALKTDSDYQKFIAASEVAVVKFTATWCGPCRALTPELEKQAGYFADRDVKFAEVDVDQHRELSKKMGVESIPDVRVFVGGREYAQVVGLEPRQIANLIESVAPSAAPRPTEPATPAADSPASPNADAPSVEETRLEDELWPNE